MASLRALALVVFAWAAAARLDANPPDVYFNNLWQTLRARQALLSDPALAPLNLGVKVNDRIAVLWGPVPSLHLAARAEARLRGMIELNDVRNELVVMPDDPRDSFTPVPARPQLVPEKVPPLPEAPRPFLRDQAHRPALLASWPRNLPGVPR